MHAYDECRRLRDEGKSQGSIRAFCEDVGIMCASHVPCSLRSLIELHLADDNPRHHLPETRLLLFPL